MITLQQITPKNIVAFIQGYYRWFVYNRFFPNFIRGHIVEQYLVRMRSVDEECIKRGECKMCGCKTPQLFWANKSCDKPCYPPMMNKKTWNTFMEDEDWLLIVVYNKEFGTGLKFIDKHEILEK